MPPTRALLAVALVFAVGACSSAEEGRAPVADRASTTPHVSVSPRPWDGIAYPVWSAGGYGSDEVRDGLAAIAETGAPAVVLTPTWYVTDTATSLPDRDPEQTATDDSLRDAVDEAHRLGMKVVLKPHVDLEDDGDRADIVPTDAPAWFGRYREMMGGYARLAEDAGVELVSVGTELAGTMDQQDEWASTIAAIRAVYSGPLTYAANFDSYADVQFWPQLDFIGVDAYYELVDRPTTDVDELVAAWQPVLDGLGSFAAELGKPALFTEAGFVSQVGTTTQPWNWELDGDAAPDEQAAGYRALLDAVADRPWLQGVLWWMWDDLADTGEDQSLDYTPHGKPAEDVLRSTWGTAR